MGYLYLYLLLLTHLSNFIILTFVFAAQNLLVTLSRAPRLLILRFLSDQLSQHLPD